MRHDMGVGRASPPPILLPINVSTVVSPLDGKFQLKAPAAPTEDPLWFRLLHPERALQQPTAKQPPHPAPHPYTPPEQLSCCELFTLQSKHNRMVSVRTTLFQKNNTERWEDAGSRDDETELVTKKRRRRTDRHRSLSSS